MIIKLSIEQHQALTQLLSHPDTEKYRLNRYDTGTFDSMVESVYDGINHLTIDDF